MYWQFCCAGRFLSAQGSGFDPDLGNAQRSDCDIQGRNTVTTFHKTAITSHDGVWISQRKAHLHRKFCAQRFVWPTYEYMQTAYLRKEGTKRDVGVFFLTFERNVVYVCECVCVCVCVCVCACACACACV